MEDYLSNFKPQVSVLDEFVQLNPNYSEPELAFYANRQVVLIKKAQEVLYLALGKILKEIRDKKLYKHLDYNSFSQYCNSDDISFSKEKAHMYIRVYEFYVGNLMLKEDDLKNFDLTRLAMMIPILKKIEEPDSEKRKEVQIEKLEQMGSLTYNDFINEINQIKNSDKPIVHFDTEMDKWIVKYYQDRTELIDRGEYEPRGTT